MKAYVISILFIGIVMLGLVYSAVVLLGEVIPDEIVDWREAYGFTVLYIFSFLGALATTWKIAVWLDDDDKGD